LKFKIITLFPEFFTSPLSSGLLGKASLSGIIKIEIINLRSFSEDKFKRCDNYSYGGGNGMILTPGPLFKALESVKNEQTRVLLPCPGGKLLNQNLVKELSKEEEICIICGHYEGVDHRVTNRFVNDEISVGDYLLSGGEFASLIIIDTIARYIPGFMSNPCSLKEESFENDLLEYPQYTRPSIIDGWEVPAILLSGNHEKIRKWRIEKSIEKTKKARPDLYQKYLARKE